jgi:hypothetical protein
LPEPKARSVAASAVRSDQDSRRARLEFVDADLFGLSSTRLHPPCAFQKSGNFSSS